MHIRQDVPWWVGLQPPSARGTRNSLAKTAAGRADRLAAIRRAAGTRLDFSLGAPIRE